MNNNEEENKLNEIWETPEVTVLNVNEDTENGEGLDYDLDHPDS